MVDVLVTGFVVLFVLSVFGVGLYSQRMIESSDQFYGATKLFGAAVITLASMSGIMSAFGFIGGPGLVYKLGTSSLWITFAAGLGFAMAYWMVGKRVRGMADVADIGTLGDIADERFQSGAVRALLAIILFIACWAYLASQVSGGGYVLAQLLGVNQDVAVWLVFGVMIIYVAAGGMASAQLAGAYTGGVMLIGVVGVVIGFLQVTGGMGHMTMTVAQAGEVSAADITKAFTPKLLNGWGLAKGGAPGLLLIWPIVFSIGVMGQPQVLQRMFSIDKPEGLRTVGLVSGVTYAVGSLLWMLIGFVALYMVASGDVAPFANPDLAAFKFVNQLHIALQMIIYAGLVAAIMSTAAFFMSVASGAIARDLMRAGGWEPSERRETWLGRITVVVVGVGAVIFGLYGGHLVAILGTFGWGTFVSGTIPAVVIGMLWKDASREGVTAGLLTALVLNVVLLAATQLGYSFPIGMDFYFIVISASIVVSVFVSLVTDGASGENVPEHVKPIFDL
ncbi:MAG: sodium:proline symporter [Halodesulfurarchaeum sp.]